MASKAEVGKRLLAAIQERTGGQKPCVLCGHTQWTVNTAFTAIQVSKNPLETVLGGPGQAMPTVAMICTHCGNTHLLNLLVLGFTEAELPSLKIDEDGPAKL